MRRDHKHGDEPSVYLPRFAVGEVRSMRELPHRLAVAHAPPCIVGHRACLRGGVRQTRQKILTFDDPRRFVGSDERQHIAFADQCDFFVRSSSTSAASLPRWQCRSWRY